MSIRAYELAIYDDDGVIVAVYLDEARAERHKESALNHPWAAELHTKTDIYPIKVESLSDQSVQISGHHIGYQFSSAAGGGKRTFKRTVKNLRPYLDTFAGDVNVLGRTVEVFYYSPLQKWYPYYKRPLGR